MNGTDGERVLVLRHGRTALNVADQLRGHLDPPLDDEGRAEVAALAREIAAHRPVRILSSPLQRAVETARALSERVGVPVEVEPRLLDRDYGAWAGHEKTEVIARWGSVDLAPGVEPGEEVVRRVREVLDEQVGRLGDGPVVLVGHDATNSRLIHMIDPDRGDAEAIGQRTACWNVLARAHGAWTVEEVDRKSGS